MSKDTEIEEDFEHKIKARWLKWRHDFRVLCNQHIPTKNANHNANKIEGRISLENYLIGYDLGAECFAIRK